MVRKEKLKSGCNIVLKESEKKKMKEELEKVLDVALFDILNFDREDDNFTRTPHRVAKMLVYEVFEGCFTKKPICTAFDNTHDIDQVVVLGPMKMKSMCAHHFMPFQGDVYFAYRVSKKLIGASKPERMLDWVARRPQTQEFLIKTFLKEMGGQLQHEDVMAVAINVNHNCMTHRGINAHETKMFNVEVNGCFKKDMTYKEEVMDLIKISEARR